MSNKRTQREEATITRYTFREDEYNMVGLLLRVYHHLEILQKAQGEGKDWFGDDLANLFAVISIMEDKARETVEEEDDGQ